MRLSHILSFAVAMAPALAGNAWANACETPKLVCSTTMPVGGFCECSAHGTTEDGTVVAKRPAHRKAVGTPVGCGTQANQPGCK